jgi:salicylate hydroxylase
MPAKTGIEKPLEIAVIGGGIVGLAVTVGLIHRGIPVKLYEKTSSFRPIGAGIGFTPNTKDALELLHPGALAAERKVATANGDPENPNDWLRYLDGYHHTTEDEDEERLIFQLYTGFRGFEGCVRAHFLEELLKLIPEGIIHFSKSVENITQRGDDEGVLIHFKDGSTAEADAGKLLPSHRTEQLCIIMVYLYNS